MSKSVLITGAGGFIGAHFVEHFLAHTDFKVVGLDSFWHKGTTTRLSDIPLVMESLSSGKFQCFKHDLTTRIDSSLNKQIGKACNWKVDYVINLASNSAVERSMTDPTECWRNNCDIILNMLEFVRSGIGCEKFLQMSTDEVYGDYVGTGAGNIEWDTMLPSNPYAASKAAQEMLCQAYWRSFETPIVIVNTMNNIGERQDAEKFLPKIIEYVSTGKTLKVYTDNAGKPGSRVYLDAKNHASAVEFILRNCPVYPYNRGYGDYDRPAKVNVAGDNELDNFEFAKLVARLMGKELNAALVTSESVRPGYDKRYLLDGKVMENMGWKPPIAFEDTLARIIKHSQDKPWWIGAN